MGIIKINDTHEEYIGKKDYYGSSSIKLANTSELDYLSFSNANRSSSAQDFGTAVHMAILEPHLYEKKYYTLDDSEKVKEIGGGNPRGTKLYKEWIAEKALEYDGKTMLDIFEFNGIERIKKNLQQDERYEKYIVEQEHEISFYAENFYEGMNVKIRPDNSLGHLPEVDIKTTKAVDPMGFKREVFKYGYHIQRALYRDVLRAYGYEVPASIILAIANSAPYNYEFYTIPEQWINDAVPVYQAGLDAIKGINNGRARFGFAHRFITDEYGCVVLGD